MCCPENEELQEGINCEETPVAEEVAAIEEPPVEEAPAVEEVSAIEEPPAEEAPAVEEISLTKKEAKKAAKAAKKAAKKKRKVWPWIVGVFAFLLVAAFAFCFFFVNPYFTKKNAYEKAVVCLEAGDFDGALENFGKAGDYKDAATYLKDLQGKEAAYSAAVTDMEEGRYAQAAEAFEKLTGYRDSALRAQASLLKLALSYLQDQNVEAAFALTEKMEQSTHDRFLDTYEKTYADVHAIAAVAQLAAERLAATEQEDYTLYDILNRENNGLAVFADFPAYADARLEELIDQYCQGVRLQFSACVEGENTYDNRKFYEGALQRAQAIESLMEEYGLLADNETVAAAEKGNIPLYETMLALQSALEETAGKAETVKGANGKTYLPFTNSTDVAVKFRFQNNYYKGDTYMGGNEAYLYALPGETVYIPIDSTITEYDRWETAWQFLDVYTGYRLQVEAGTYKLQSMVLEGVFHDLEVLETMNITPDSVVMHFNGDTNGRWTGESEGEGEEGFSNAFTYSESIIALDGTDWRLPYTAAPGKVVIDLSSVYDTPTIYVLTLEN